MSNVSVTKRFGIFALAIVLGLALAALSLTGCGSSSGSKEDKTITVAATATPHAEILNDVVAPILKEKGYTLEVSVQSDYSIPNKMVAEKEADANYFQHQPYLDSENSEFGYNLVSIASVHYEPFGLYSKTLKNVADIEDGAKVLVPNDTTNEARALLLLQQEGLIEVDPAAGITATKKDITSNPKNLEIIEVDAEQTALQLEDASLSAINSNYALSAGLSPAKDALAVEAADGEAATTYANIVAVRDGDQDSEWAKALTEAITSDEVRDYINKTYDGAVLPAA
jgi:D-methionine transport system substrate-binding protein